MTAVTLAAVRARAQDAVLSVREVFLQQSIVVHLHVLRPGRTVDQPPHRWQYRCAGDEGGKRDGVDGGTIAYRGALHCDVGARDAQIAANQGLFVQVST
jgi:hypothetical protein